MVKQKKILVVIMDGLGDRSNKEIGGKTPLQAMDTPNLDRFVEKGMSGLCDVIAPGIKPGSDTAHLAILGYDPREVYTGRGPFEAAGIGVIGERGDVALRCNFASVNEDMVVTDRRAGRIKEPDTQELISALQGITIKGIEIIVKEGTEHRAALLLRGPGLSEKVTDVDPHDLIKVKESEGLVPEAQFTAHIVNEFVKICYETLKDHPINKKRASQGLPPANILLPRGAGRFPDIDPFPKIHNIKAAGVAGVGMIRGICGVCGLDVVDLPQECTGGVDCDFMVKAKHALKALQDYDFVLINFKAPDVAGHDGDVHLKCEIVRKLDEVAGYLYDNMPEDLVIVFTADHSTPCTVMDHSADPVPITIYSDDVVSDKAVKFSESGCSIGSLGRMRGFDIVPICMDLANRSEKYGA
ncbi:MAG TPA: 2,3-bisphosphoglycerate-independent phosphoglycerate mutase [Candidatus Methanomethylophilaceae archaeon]|nr:2,3-bisphosphoglycerate-independent phosphoglycerate mutase [Candidatus Methanomethylophilaceae archaeon]